MAIVKITELPAATSPVNPSDVAAVVQDGVTKKASINQFGYLPAGPNVVTRTIQSKLHEIVSVADYGASPSASAQVNTDAFYAASQAIQANGGGTLIIPAGTYTVGYQTFAGQFGLGYSYAAAPMLGFNNCTRPVVVEGNGAVLRMASGLRFGSFNPQTGAVFNPALPFTNSDYAAGLGVMININNNQNVTIRNLELDGNITNAILGGFWGDTGRQIAAYGILGYDNENVLVENVYTHHHCLDGVAFGYVNLTETSPPKPHTLINVVSEYNARQGFSWVGGNSMTAINCKFNYTGQAVFSSSPGAGLDIEAESSVCRNGVFIDCEMRDNAGVGMVADSGDSADVQFIGCKFIGKFFWAIWPNKPRFAFSDCIIVGPYVNSFFSANDPVEATKYVRCYFTDEAKFSATLYNVGSLGSNLSETSAQANVTYENCQFVTTRTRPGRFDGAVLRDCTFNMSFDGTNIVNNQDYVAIVWGAKLENVRFNDFITTNLPADAYFVSFAGGEVLTGYNFINSSGNKVKWYSWSAGASGFTGQLDSTPQIVGQYTLGWNQRAIQTIGTAPPVAGTWNRGSRVFNSEPAIGSPKSWVCTVGGTPGTWESEGNL